MAGHTVMRVLVLMLAVLSVASAAEGAAGSGAVIRAKDFFKADSPTSGIQDAIDVLPKEGGTVLLEPRTYLLRRALVLQDNVTLLGVGRRSILTRGKQIATPLTKDAAKDDTVVTVASSEGLRVGDEIAIKDSKHGGWWTAHALITKIEGNALHLDDKLVKDFTVERKAILFNHHPMIEVYRVWWSRPHVKNVTIENLTIDGNLKENPGPVGDWSLAAIHLATAQDAVVRNCIVRNFPSDGISDQYGLNNLIESNLVENCRGSGFHLGTGIKGTRFVNNVARNNTGDGLYFCAACTGLQVLHNQFISNKGNGIGGIGQGKDRFNLVSGNICRENGRHGIHAIQGSDNTITGNICIDNSASKPGAFSGVMLDDVTATIVSGNRCGTAAKNATQRYGIEEKGKSDRNVITGNICVGNKEGGLVTIGKDTRLSGNICASEQEKDAEKQSAEPPRGVE